MIRRPVRPSLKPIVRRKALRAVGPRGQKRRAEYARYLKSATWRRIRDCKIRSASYAYDTGVVVVRCERCAKPLVVRCPDSDYRDRIEVHHKKYPKVLGEEALADLAIRCEGCQQHHDHWYRRP